MPDPTIKASDAIAAPLLDVLSLFDGPLQKVTFPDVDRAKLHELAVEVRRAADEVEKARALLTAAEATLDERRRALATRSQRALAYARVYAAEDLELREKLDRISLVVPQPRASAAMGAVPIDGEAAPKKRGRPRKSTGESLFEGGAPSGRESPSEAVEASAAE